jgi:hypothetical protein
LPPGTASIAAIHVASDQRVLLLWRPRWLASLVKTLGLGDIRTRTGARETIVVLCLALTCLTVGAMLILKIAGVRPDTQDFIAVWYVVLIGLMLWWADGAWRRAGRLTQKLDSIVAAPNDRKMAMAWLDRRLQMRPQVYLSAIVGISGLAFSIMANGNTTSDSVRELPYLLTFTIVCVGAANVAYWLISAVTFLRKFSNIKLITMEDSERDPAIEGCKALVWHVQLRLCVGLVAAELPLLPIIHYTPSSKAVIDTKVIVLLFCALALLTIAILPAILVRKIQHTSEDLKVKELRELAKAIPDRTLQVGFDNECKLVDAVEKIRRPNRRANLADAAQLTVSIVAVFLPLYGLLALHHSGL